MEPDEISGRARRLAAALEPVVGQVYFAPECHANYAALGFDPSPAHADGVALPDGPAYFTSRGSLMGKVPGEVVAAAFAVFNPAVVLPAVQLGWTRTDAPTICQARTDGAIAQLQRILGDEPDGCRRARDLLERAAAALRPEGRPLFAGVRSQPIPSTAIGALWRYGDMLREYRGDCHTAAWTAADFDAVEISLLSELYWGLPMRTYARTRAWSDADFDIATERLQTRGLIDTNGFTPRGRSARDAVEFATDAPMRAALEAIGDDLDELIAILEPWGASIRAAKGYLQSGPHDLAERAGGGQR